MEIKDLIKKAFEARGNAYAPYSRFKVGAALICENGKIYCGCNIESASFSPTNCAERTAFFKAISDGERHFCAIAIVGAHSDAQSFGYCPPCGVCRQVMSEFCAKDFKIILADSDEEYIEYTLEELLPLGFELK